MNNKREMKIEISETQPLNLVVEALEKLGFVENGFDDKAKSVTTYADGTFSAWRFGIERCYHHNDLVTLAELNNLQVEG
ncbi:hypothetical protein IIQ44_14555 [Acinetobacter oleivorans]|uniref:hypothetical protein n=1 Tax=Acinetobacter oleivorans TaxID=1148157 RepID=UPI00178CCF6D|nr:hypothetical protein [Acinetobacter oleivorans]MBE2173116.1 hypothetical protein [Acinetobacter oleivorans]HEM6664010.1 hypothetical protein [Acinetobacter baumannii]